MRKHIVLFVQPDISRHFDFMKMYEHGLITDWERDPKAARKQLNAFVDAVVVDLGHGEKECLELCQDAKRSRADRVVIYLQDGIRKSEPDGCADLVLPRNVSQMRFIGELIGLLKKQHTRAG